MKKEYESPVLISLQYVFEKDIAADGELDINISSLLPPPQP